jgi:nucleoside-diphosphate-sugar epimerase
MLFDLSKLLGEWLVLRNPNGKVIRLGNVFGGQPGGNTFLSEIIGSIQKGEMNLVVKSSPSIDRYYIHIDDVCSALHGLTRTAEVQILNLAYSERVSNAQIAEILEKHGISLKFTAGTEITQVKRQVEISFESVLTFENTFESRFATEIQRR